MRLTTFTDYAVRVLIYAAAADGRLVTISETAAAYDISRAHLMKVVNNLTRAGYLKGVRGRAGGFTLTRSPEAINLGELVRLTEPDFAMAECFSSDNRCAISRCCGLSHVLGEALDAFLSTLDRHTLADIMPGRLIFDIPAAPSADRGINPVAKPATAP